MESNWSVWSKRAWKETLQTLGLNSPVQLLIRLVLAGIAISAIWFAGSKEALKDEIFIRLALTLGVAALVPIGFLIALIGAPYRTERDLRLALQDRLARHESKSTRRALNEEQKGVLAGTIRDSGIRPDSLNVIFDTTDGECKDFAADIGDAIQMANIESTVHHGPMYTGNPRDRGIKIIRKKTAVLQKLANGIASQLKDFGYLVEQRDSDEEQIFIVVARRAE